MPEPIHEYERLPEANYGMQPYFDSTCTQNTTVIQVRSKKAFGLNPPNKTSDQLKKKIKKITPFLKQPKSTLR
jgi:hypothetical protein